MVTLTKREFFAQVIFDVFCILLVYIPWIALQFVEPYQRGFFCDDESIKYPYKPSTISGAANTVFCLLTPLAFIFLIEGIQKFKLRRLEPVCISHATVTINTSTLHPYFVDCYHFILFFLFGAAASQTITNIGKVSLGRLRPHFISVCQPDYRSISCRDSQGLYQLQAGHVCTYSNFTSDIITDSRLSFPSGHASLSWYCMMYLTIYLQKRLTWNKSELFRPTLQVLAITAALLISLSRITDFKHHWSDVLAGAVLGIAAALLTALCLDHLHTMDHSTIARQVRTLYQRLWPEPDVSSISGTDTSSINIDTTPQLVFVGS